jgi:2-isopropylmalate synthase
MKTESVKKYKPYGTMDYSNRTWPDKTITSAPTWCSVDLRDGNQALVQPMNLKQKIELFELLVDVGFKEIEIGFPSASEVEFEFCRTLIEDNLIPDDVSIQVLTPARDSLIHKTFKAVEGAKNVIMHLYNSTSTLQRRTVFRMNRNEIEALGVEGAQIIKKEAARFEDTNFRFEYTPESFTGTELDFAMQICESIMNVWEPTVEHPVILNLPATVELSTPNTYADRIEWFCTNIRNRDSVIVSLHAHNDRGCAVAATELALMAGADRVEGTLFGNGERTGNVDLVTLGLNMFTQGVDPELDLHDINRLIEVSEQVTDIPVHIRHPYAGELVYTAFSGSHQDAIKKGMESCKENDDVLWAVPYLPIDPVDVGRTYESIIRINSQSGKGGVAYLMDMEFGLKIPKRMHPEFGKIIQQLTEKVGRVLKAAELWDAFESTYLQSDALYGLESFNVVKRHIDNNEADSAAEVEAVVTVGQEKKQIMAKGNGPLDAFCSALKKDICADFTLNRYHEHALSVSSSSKAVAYIEIIKEDGSVNWGVGIDTDIIIASIKAVLSSLNRTA